MSADHTNLVIDPISDIWASDVSQEQHGALQGIDHCSGSVIEDPVDIPFSEECLDFGSIPIEYFWFSSD
jgi:hypothetical protein